MTEELSYDGEQAIVKLAREVALSLEPLYGKTVRVEYRDTESHAFGSASGILNSSHVSLSKTDHAYPIYVWFTLGGTEGKHSFSMGLESKISIVELSTAPINL